MEPEKKFNETIKRLGLSEWTVLWEPGSTQPSRGQVFPEAKTIIVHDKEPEAAMETLLHEVVELKLRPMLKPYRTLVNALIKWADERVYEAKEKAIEDLLPFLIKFVENGCPSHRNLKDIGAASLRILRSIDRKYSKHGGGV